MEISKMGYNNKTGNLYIEYKFPVKIGFGYIENCIKNIFISLENPKIRVNGIGNFGFENKRIDEIIKILKSENFHFIQISGIDSILNKELSYKIILDSFEVMCCIIGGNTNYAELAKKRMQEIWIKSLGEDENGIKLSDVCYLSKYTFLSYYETDKMEKLFKDVKNNGINSLMVSMLKWKIIINLTKQYKFYAIPISISKNGVEQPSSVGYYMTENVYRQIYRNNHENDLQGFTYSGQKLHLVDATPIYQKLNGENYLMVFDSAIYARKYAEKDVCYCTMEDIKNACEILDDSNKFIYNNAESSIIFNKNTIIEDIFSVPI